MERHTTVESVKVSVVNFNRTYLHRYRIKVHLHTGRITCTKNEVYGYIERYSSSLKGNNIEILCFAHTLCSR